MYKNSSGNLKEKDIGYDLSGLAIGLCGHPDLTRFFLQMQFDATEALRFRFCLLFYNIALIVWWINMLVDVDLSHVEKSTMKRILDEMLEQVMDALRQNQSWIKFVDFIVDKKEIESYTAQFGVNDKTTTNYSTLFNNFYDSRVQTFLQAFTKQVELASKRKQNGFSVDPVAKLFVQHFKGDDWKNYVSLIFHLTNILSSFRDKIIDYIYENTGLTLPR